MYKLKIDNDCRHWFKNGKCHRSRDFPAIITAMGNKYWCKDGIFHRDNDLPAIERVDGTKEWRKYGKEYYIEEYDNGSKEYYDENKNLHKDDGPAVNYSNGDKEYWCYGKRHRKNGPAVIIGNKQYWFENGEFKKCIVY